MRHEPDTRRSRLRLGKRSLAALLVVAACAFAAPAWSSGQADETVRITSAGFEPATTRIVRGDTVTWTNADTVNHRIASTTPRFRSPVLRPGDTFSFRFNQLGTFTVRDELKPGTTGRVNVAAQSPLSVAIQRERSIVTYGGWTRIYGSVSNGRSGEPVTVVASAYRLGTDTRRANTDDGAWELLVQPKIRTLYRAVWRGRESQAEPAVYVRPRVALSIRNRRLGRLTTKVTAAYSYAGKRVRLLRSIGGGKWRTVRSVRLGRGGAVTFRARLPRVASVRIAVPASPGYLQGQSRTVTVRR